ncbi:MAG: methyltransferase family protein [Chloroflexota bacterium]
MSKQTKAFPWRAVVQMVLIVIVAPLLPMLISGRWDWWQAWVYALLSILSFAVSRALAARRHPDLIAERARFLEAKDTKPWDKILAPLLGLGSVVILIVAGLDKLYGWSSAFSMPAHVISVIAIILGYAFSSWALIENRFFSGTVRIQTDRDHKVVSTGPYRIVRHPGYAGGLFGYVFIPLLLDSLWAFVPTVLLAGVMILRTALEDKTLQAELPGYREFAQKTKYRLIPGVW